MIVVDLGPSILNWLASRKPGAKAAAMLIGLGQRDIAAMAAHDPLTNGQTQSGTIGTIRQKGFKNSGLDGLRDARSAIFYGKGNRIIFCLGTDTDVSSIRHRLDSIENEVESDLLDLPFL